jgi:hypothetical protein
MRGPCNGENKDRVCQWQWVERASSVVAGLGSVCGRCGDEVGARAGGMAPML